MISVDEARALVQREARPLGETENVPLVEAVGRVLAGPVRAVRDDPPFDRSMMDGYAVRAADLPGSLDVVGRIAAGDAELPAIGAGQAAWINTGAPLPPGADAVVPVELTRGDVTIDVPAEAGTHILARGGLARAGDVVVAGRLSPEGIAACAAQAADPVEVIRRPRVAVLSTGTELRAEPGINEIRNSNGPMLKALLRGYEVLDLGVASDDPAVLDEVIGRGLEADALVTTGGISKGELDLVRPALVERGVEVVFHGVALQPGKPVLFGRHETGLVFALPGNPVSVLVCADLFVLPGLAALAGRGFSDIPTEVFARLAAPARANPKRRRVLPCRLAGAAVEPLEWRGSADLYTVANANAYFVLEPGADKAAGDEVRCLIPER